MEFDVSTDVMNITKYKWQNTDHPVGLFIILSFISAGLAVCIIFVNILMIITIAREKKLRTPTNIIAMNIAFVDLLQGLLATPMRLIMNYEYDIAKDIVYGAVTSKYLCIMRLGFSTIPCGLTLLLFIVLSADRHVAIVYPFKYDKMKRYVGIACGMCWLFSGIMFVKPIVDLKEWNASMVCANYSDWLPNHALLIYIWIAISISISTGLHIQIQLIAQRQRNNIVNQIIAVDHNAAVAYKKGFRVLKSSIMLFGFFVGMWGSFLILRVQGNIFFRGNIFALKIWSKVINKITLTISFLNPIIFAQKQRVLKKALRANCKIKCGFRHCGKCE